MNNMEFTTKTFKITENVSFSILMSYFDGHPICQTKSLKLMYHGQLQEMKSGSRLYESLIPKGLVTQEAINLLNYLSRLIYGENVYDVYVNSSNQSDYVSEMKEYITHNQSASTGGLINRFDLVDGLLNSDMNINVEELNKHRNEDFPLVVHNFDEIEVAPLFTYVHSNLTINRGETVHLCHFAFLLERLSHLSAYPEFNNQAIMSLLGNAFESEESGLTIEEITKDKYEEIVEENNKLKKSLSKEVSAHEETKKLLRQIQKQNTQVINQNNELKETIDELYNMNLSSGVTIRSMDKKLNQIADVGRAIHNQISTIQAKDIKQHKTNDVLILYTSAEKPRDNDIREHIPENYIWIATFNGQPRNFRYPNVPRDRVVIFESNSNRLDSFRSLLDKPNINRFIHQTTPQRDILIRIDQQDEFIRVIQEELDRDDNYPVVNDLDVATIDQVSNEEINFKRNLLEHYNPCLININRYKRRLYAEVNNELVLVEDIDDAYNYKWMYRYGPSGRLLANIDLNLLQHSRFTNERDTRITYE